MNENDKMYLVIRFDALHISPKDVQHLIELLTIIKNRPVIPGPADDYTI